MTRRIPSVKANEIVRALERAGFRVSRVSGSHCRLIHANDPTRKVTVPLHSRTNVKPDTLKSILAQAGLSIAEFVALL